MKRIGIAASKMAKGNLALYNFYVVFLSCLFSFLIFIISGSTVIFSLIVISYIAGEIIPVEINRDWSFILIVCMTALTVIISLLNLTTIIKNIKTNLDK